MGELNNSVELKKLDTTHPVSGIFQVCKLITSFKPDVIVSSNHRVTSLVYNARRFVKIKPLIVAQLHNVHSVEFASLNEKKRKKRVRKMANLYKRLDAIISVSKACTLDFSRMTGVDAGKIVSILNPVVDNSLKALIDADAQIEKELFSKPTILFVGHLVKQKNVEFLLASFEYLRAKRDCQLLIVGDGPEASSLQLKAKLLKFNNDIHFIGHRDNPFPYMKHANVFAMCSSFEGFGNVVVESLACGTPVVSTPCGGPQEIIVDGLYGELVPSFDPEKYAVALGRWLDRDLKKLGVELDIYIESNYSVSAVSERYISTIENLSMN